MEGSKVFKDEYGRTLSDHLVVKGLFLVGAGFVMVDIIYHLLTKRRILEGRYPYEK